MVGLARGDGAFEELGGDGAVPLGYDDGVAVAGAGGGGLEFVGHGD